VKSWSGIVPDRKNEFSLRAVIDEYMAEMRPCYNLMTRKRPYCFAETTNLDLRVHANTKAVLDRAPERERRPGCFVCPWSGSASGFGLTLLLCWLTGFPTAPPVTICCGVAHEFAQAIACRGL